MEYTSQIIKWLTILFVTISVSGSTPTVINLPDGAYMDMALIPRTCAEDGQTGQIQVGVSTGPYITKASTGDCYLIPYINPNGSCGPSTWIVCPQ